MAKLIYTAIMSLDGYVADEDGNFDWAEPDEDVHSFVNDLERPIGTYLYGRRLYDVMVAWETIDDEHPFIKDYAQIWRAADKVVYYRALEEVSSARTRIERNFDPDVIRRMKAEMEREAREAAEKKATATKQKQEEAAMQGKKVDGRWAKIIDPSQVLPAPKTKRNFTDPDSRIMKDQATKTFQQAYNVQIGVDAQAQIIVAAGSEMRVAGGPYTVPISINNATRLSTIVLSVTYNPAVLRVRTVQDGTFMRQGGVTASFTPRPDANAGRVDVTISRTGDQTGASGAGLLAALIFDAIAPGPTTLTVAGVASAPDGTPLPLIFSPVSVTVR